MLSARAADDLPPVRGVEVEDQVGACIDEDLHAQVDILPWFVGHEPVVLDIGAERLGRMAQQVHDVTLAVGARCAHSPARRAVALGKMIGVGFLRLASSFPGE